MPSMIVMTLGATTGLPWASCLIPGLSTILSYVARSSALFSELLAPPAITPTRSGRFVLSASCSTPRPNASMVTSTPTTVVMPITVTRDAPSRAGILRMAAAIRANTWRNACMVSSTPSPAGERIHDAQPQAPPGRYRAARQGQRHCTRETDHHDDQGHRADLQQ